MNSAALLLWASTIGIGVGLHPTLDETPNGRRQSIPGATVDLVDQTKSRCASHEIRMKPVVDQAPQLAQFSRPYDASRSGASPVAATPAAPTQFDPYAKASVPTASHPHWPVAGNPTQAPPTAAARSPLSNPPMNAQGQYYPNARSTDPPKPIQYSPPVQNVVNPLREGIDRIDDRARETVDAIGDRTQDLFDALGRPLANRPRLLQRKQEPTSAPPLVKTSNPYPNGVATAGTAPLTTTTSSANNAANYNWPPNPSSSVGVAGQPPIGAGFSSQTPPNSSPRSGAPHWPGDASNVQGDRSPAGATTAGGPVAPQAQPSSTSAASDAQSQFDRQPFSAFNQGGDPSSGSRRAQPASAGQSLSPSPSRQDALGGYSNPDRWTSNNAAPSGADPLDRTSYGQPIAEGTSAASSVPGSQRQSNPWMSASAQQRTANAQGRTSLGVSIGGFLANNVGSWFGPDKDGQRVASNPRDGGSGPSFPYASAQVRERAGEGVVTSDYEPFASSPQARARDAAPSISSSMLRRPANAELRGGHLATAPENDDANSRAKTSDHRTSLGAVLAAWVLLAGSAAGNLYLFWSYVDVRARLQSISRQQARSAGPRLSAA